MRCGYRFGGLGFRLRVLHLGLGFGIRALDLGFRVCDFAFRSDQADGFMKESRGRLVTQGLSLTQQQEQRHCKSRMTVIGSCDFEDNQNRLNNQVAFVQIHQRAFLLLFASQHFSSKHMTDF